jgi:chromatin structure-remodeling complex protein RSC7
MAATRKSTHDGVYDPHTNMMFYPTIMQPTHAKWEQIPSPPLTESSQYLTNGATHTNGTTHTNGDHISDPMSIDPPTQQSIFTSVPPVVSRNYAVIDTTYTAPPISNAGYPGPDGTITDATSGTLGLSSISSDILDELPEDCRRAFEEARAAEVGWKQQWGTEAQSGLRGGLKIGFSGYPV